MNKIGNDYYRVSWEHNRQPKYLILTCGDYTYKVLNKEKSTTTCFLKDDEHKIIFQSTVTLNPKDGNYIKEVGRTESLFRVLTNLDEGQSEEIAMSYWNRRPVEQAMLL